MTFSDQQLEIIQPNIENYVNSIVFCDKDSEDIIQNVNLILIKKRLEFDRSKKLLHWAMTICRFQIKKYLTRKKRFDKKFANFEHRDFPIIIDPLHNLVKEEKKILDERIKKYLSPRQYCIYNLLNKGYTIPQISDKLKLKKPLVSRSKSAMIYRLRSFFKNEKETEYTEKK